ncbi:osmoprotectant transport system permease protein [Clostridium acidisoli DSM 12555]|uniref:Osmoprotectant transport system permease protein n=1 Tax=Clostridium acidisoli DSM 12555 TaxID=1121291 RepID=A0A1W1XS13_9CLOT|nr:osmoprotectant transport system permease protein [Clostridium acidisoli DSM 12555]
MIKYLFENYSDMLTLLSQHIYLVAMSVLISLLIAIPIVLIIFHSKILSAIVLALFGVLYSIPSLAMFAFLIPVLGLGEQTAIVVLIIYNQYILVRNILVAFQSIDPSIIEAAKGMGLSSMQLFINIQIPLALPIILGGTRIAMVSTIGVATIAAVINAGGLGVMLFDGLRMNYLTKILWGTIMSAGLSLITNQVLLVLEKIASQKARGECGSDFSGKI